MHLSLLNNYYYYINKSPHKTPRRYNAGNFSRQPNSFSGDFQIQSPLPSNYQNTQILFYIIKNFPIITCLKTITTIYQYLIYFCKKTSYFEITSVWKQECSPVKNGCLAESARILFSIIVHSTSSSWIITSFFNT